MNVLIDTSTYKDEYVYISEPVPNNIIKNGLFYKINYSTEFVTLNCIYIIYKQRTVYTADDILQNNFQIKNIERQILSNPMFNNKAKLFKLTEFIDFGLERFISSGAQYITTNLLYVIKISGVWETETNCGLTYKLTYTRL